ncbi:hypothetical protein BC937DRAFT_88902 [Endogone sp. FLAS-F59071]|nr:hypothetical protein BC937DRAFT_88901 [Endogone sp. FLAS-F59071]RUS23435.1 hypothetical protein BC937DRAFT_88902 [Endogone sp. FLAS-F59071]|eukprot:RUS23434.1 hypothetical protein BC937DRAFT_88901 [Endogone sp. FLAS-F59071]
MLEILKRFLIGKSAIARINSPPDPRFFERDQKAEALRLPSIRDMLIKYCGFVDALLKFGVFVKEKEIEFAPIKNKMNRYIKKQVKRLKKLAASGQHRAFWRLWLRIVARSVSFGYLALHKVIPDWYKDMSFDSVKKILGEFKVIRRHLAHSYVVREKEIPKPNGKIRTLSIPKKSWRLYLYLVNLGLHLFLNPLLSDRQFGHRAGMGVMKCWDRILREYQDWTYIYEFDFKAFHPSISFSLIEKALLFYNVPPEVVAWLIKINNPKVKPASGGKAVRRGIGVPQGVATSAIIGMLVLEYLKIYNIKDATYIGFADDGIVGGRDPLLAERLKNKLPAGSGIEINEDKSGWVMEDGIWKKPLKFLGATFDGGSEVFNSKSRSGNDYIFELGGPDGLSTAPELSNPFGVVIPEGKGRLGTAKWWDERFLKYALFHNFDPESVPDNVSPMTWKDALKLDNGMNVLMGTVWCGKSPPPDLELKYTDDSLVGRMKVEEMERNVRRSDLTLRNASTQAFLALLKSEKK